jgi:DNA replication protein DnaC
MMNDQVRLLSHKLKLFGIHESFERRCAEAEASGLKPIEFLHLILEDEVLRKKEITGKRLLSRANFRTYADLEDWDQTYDRGLSKAELRDLSLLSFYHNRQNLILVGKTGAGKTHTAIAIGRRLCQENIMTRFLPVNFFFEEILAAKVSGKYLNYMKDLRKTDVIVLDDFGLRNYTHEEASALLDVLEDRYTKGSVIVTSQVEPEGWLKLFEDPVIADSITDRLKNPSRKILLKGDSYREKLAALSRKSEAKSNPR